jgi:hypothetical protein
MPQAKLCQQRIDRTDLKTSAAAFVSKFGGVDMIASLRYDHGECRKPIDDLRPVPRPGESLQKLLEHEAGGYQFFADLEDASQFSHVRGLVLRGTSQRQRPDIRVDEQAQWRDRSAL